MEYVCLYCYDLLITRPCLYILGSTMQVDKSKRLQERERLQYTGKGLAAWDYIHRDTAG